MTGQRTWKRVEAPGTYRGHALEATIDGTRFVGWENKDGTWSLSANGGDAVRYADWQKAREGAEQGRAENPFHPLLASAAAGGMAIAMRSYLLNNPGDEVQILLRAVPFYMMAAYPRRDRSGRIWVFAKPGHGRRILDTARRHRLPFPIQITEIT